MLLFHVMEYQVSPSLRRLGLRVNIFRRYVAIAHTDYTIISKCIPYALT